MKFSESRIKLITIFTVIITAFFSNSCYKFNNQTANTDVSNANTFEIPVPPINLAKPLEISEKAEDVELAKRIDEIIEDSEFSNARWGVFAVSLKDGRVIVAKDARKLFNPASIQKILTAIVALDKLGAGYRWKTSVFANRQIGADGSLSGDLVIYGRGAPDFNEQSLEDLANQLQAKGLKTVKGDIVGDESYFTGDDVGDGWTWNDLQWYYGAQASALTYKENQAGVYMKDGAPVASTDFVQIQNDLQPKQADKVESYGLKRGLTDNKIYIWGSGNKASGRVAVYNPNLWAAKSFRSILEKRGIKVEGITKSVDWTTNSKMNVENAAEIARVESKSLSEIVRKMNKTSNNLYAELLLRTVGKLFGDTAPDENKQLQEVRGDDSAGTSVIKKFLAENNAATDELQIHDGSGLSRLDFVTPEAFGRALIYAAQAKFSDVFKDSLPIAATDGTLGGRLYKAKGKILAKTGSITYVNSLAGYAVRDDGEIFAFSIISNNVTKKKDSSAIIDQIALSIAEKPDEKKTDEKQNDAEKISEK